MDSKVFTVEQDEKLIDLVRSYPVLWDTSLKAYKDKDVRHNAWNHISKLLGLSAEVCHIRWKTIRDTHRRNLLRSRSRKSGTFKSKYSKENFQFVDSTFKEKPVLILNVSEATDVREIEPNCSKNQESPEIEVNEVNIHDFVNNFLGVEKNNSSVAEDAVQPRKRFKNSLHPITDLVKTGWEDRRNKFLNELVANQSRQTPVKDHPVDNFFSSMAEVVKTFPPNLIAEARMKVCQVVSEIELRAIQAKQEPAHATASSESGLLREALEGS